MISRFRRMLRRRSIWRRALEIRGFVRRCIAVGPRLAGDVPQCSRDGSANMFMPPVLMAAQRRHMAVLQEHTKKLEQILAGFGEQTQRRKA